ncbi:cell division protein FtsZ [Burkholderia pseudomallei]|uniref:cell division protein FtsZ n=1 Tax=Burkholderia pseudomallei TaxID=28450 RepID=UPI000F1F6F0F|nr:cell division protein FtsZ [Burkholderia pseudomallei]CAJ5103572.1 cell division protein FtsZ [Burkholderia pseudomallei]CAJ6476125.1 cell division protein FtsZ [Burkholderia pseudomallei]VBH27909.1 cell division protein FtsZ [Burkholderia pseudomallei]
MSAPTIQKTTTADGIQFERWPARRSIGHGHDHPAVQIVGVGETGGGLAAGLYYRLGVDDGIEFQHVSATDGALSGDASLIDDHVPFAEAKAVIVIAAAGEPDALRVSVIVSAAARKAGARVVALLAQPPLPPGSLVRAVAAELSRCADAVVFVPESPHPSVLYCLVDVYVTAMRGTQPDLSEWKMPTGSDFLDVREAFSGTAGAVIGVGEGRGPDRIKDAARQAIHDVGSDRLSMAGGLLVMVSGAESLRLREVAAAAYAICEATTGDAGSVLAAHYDDRLGETVRITVIAAERDDSDCMQ